jgi:hypothetical protein
MQKVHSKSLFWTDMKINKSKGKQSGIKIKEKLPSLA